VKVETQSEMYWGMKQKKIMANIVGQKIIFTTIDDIALVMVFYNDIKRVASKLLKKGQQMRVRNTVGSWAETIYLELQKINLDPINKKPINNSVIYKYSKVH